MLDKLKTKVWYKLLDTDYDIRVDVVGDVVFRVSEYQEEFANVSAEMADAYFEGFISALGILIPKFELIEEDL